MSSWITCPCGNQLHRNLFAGAGVAVIVPDTVLDRIDEQLPASDAVDRIIRSSDILVRCPKCGRIAIEDKKTGAVSFYARVAS